MADMIKKATRESYGEALASLAADFPNLVVLDADLAGATKTGNFKKVCPERFFDCGIAEANMINTAAGLATCGMIPFASSFAMFAAGRAYEQVRNGVGYPHLNVKIGATHAGVSVGEDGATHQCNEDIALMRTIPGMTIISPCDDTETKAAVRFAAEFVGPVYLRLGRSAVENINDPSTYRFELGKAVQLHEGSDITVIATGIMVQEALAAARQLEGEGVSVRVLNMHTIKPLDREAVLKAARETGVIVTVEEHSILGGLGEAVAAVTAEECPVPVIRIGVNDRFGYSASAKQILQDFGLCADNIAKKAREAVLRKAK